MKTKFYLLMVVSALLLSNCSQEEFAQNQGKSKVLTATIEGSSRSTVTDGGVFSWSSGDALSVWNGSTFDTYTFESGNQFNAPENAVDPSDIAIYPANSGHTYVESTINVNMPTEYAHGSTNAPMLANVDDTNLAFKHLGGVMRFIVKNMPSGDGSFTFTTNKGITGTFTVSADSESKNVISAQDNGTNNTVKINYEAGEVKDPMTFYIPLPIGEYSGYTVAIGENENETSTDVVNTINRGTLLLMPTFYFDDDGKLQKSTENVVALDANPADLAVSNGEEVTVDVADDVTATLNISATEENSSITITDGSGLTASQEPEAELNIAANENVKELTIDAPTLTVNITSGNFDNITTLTATNTLNIGADVTVESLVVEGGKVRVYGTITEISRDENNNDEKTVIFKKEGATIPDNLSDDFVVIEDEDNWDGKSFYAPSYDKTTQTYSVKNAYELAWIAATVNKDNNLSGKIVSLENDINLNNKQWTPIGFINSKVAGNVPYFSGTFDGKGHTIKDLKIDVTDTGGVGLFGAVHNATFKNFTLNNVDIKAVESEDNPVDTSGDQGGQGDYIVGGQIGAVAGYDVDKGALSFDNVHLTGLIKIEGETRAVQGQRIGGVFGGKGSSTVNFNNVSVTGSEGSYIKGYCTTAGVAGQPQGVTTFTNVTTDIDVFVVKFGAAGISGYVANGSSFSNCSSAGNVTLDASVEQPNPTSANNPYRIGGIAGCWGDKSTAVITLTGCSYSGSLTSKNNDGVVTEIFDYAGYVGRGYNLNGAQGSKVIVNGVSYVQAFNEAANSGVYYVNGELIINSAANLKVFAAKVNADNSFIGVTVKLGADIDLKNEEWTPISYKANTFAGTFDGNDKTISNLKYSSTEDDWYVGLFGGSKDATFRNLTINNVDIECSKGLHFAALVGDASGNTTIENINITGNVKIVGDIEDEGVGRVGCLVGGNSGTFALKNICINVNEGSYVEGNSSIGGVAGQLQGSATFENIQSNIEVRAQRYFVGGIIGLAPATSIFKECSTTGNVTLVAGTGDNSPYRVGGIAGGWADNVNNVLTLTGCSYSGTLKSGDVTTFDCGGFVGRGYSTVVGAIVKIDNTIYTYNGNGQYTITNEVVE